MSADRFPANPSPTAASAALVRTPERRAHANVAVAPSAKPSEFSIDDIYFTLFRHKWKIVSCALIGVLAAGLFFVRAKPSYRSTAKVFIRYVTMEGMPLKQSGSDTIAKSPDMRGETIMTSEQEILTSMDLIKRATRTVGAEKIIGPVGDLDKLPGGGSNEALAAAIVALRLTVSAPRFSSVITLNFEHPDSEVAQLVLRQILDEYLKLHVEVHRSAGMVGDFLVQETDQLRARLAQTEDEMRKVAAKAGVVSIEDTKRSYANQIDALRVQIFAAQADLAQRTALLQAMTKSGQTANANAENAAAEQPKPEPAKTTAPPREEYQRILGRIATLQQREQQLLLVFSVQNAQVQDIQRQLADADEQKRQIETAHPDLFQAAASAPRPGEGGPAAARAGAEYDPQFEASQLQAIQTRITTLASQMESLRKEAANLDQLAGTVEALARKRQLEEANYRRYAASLEESRINEAMGNGSVSNISVIQAPSDPIAVPSKAQIIAGGVAVGGLGLGLGWAFLIELLLDRAVRRPNDFGRMIKVPLFLSIPAQPKKGRKRRNPKAMTRDLEPGTERGAEIIPVEASFPGSEFSLGLYHETLRDRLIGYCESRNLVHKPKLVAVTGLGPNAGVTTTATGLARSLSETGDGNVLLVDLTPGQGSAMHFHHGSPPCDMEELFADSEHAQVQDRLYVVSHGSRAEELSRHLPQRFSKLVPKFKASNFDYIIFDMPPVSQISITPRLAGFMDIVLLVVEAEKNSRESVVGAAALLAESQPNIGAVLNKTRNYVPNWLRQEFPGA